MAASTISVHHGGYDDEPYTYYPVVIIGAGSSGIAAGCRIKSALGFDQFAIFERQGGPGGVWWVNRYPGIACDIPSFFYSLSFMPHTEATQLYAKGADIVRYYWRVCNSYKITDRMQFNTDIKELRWLEDEQLWEITLARLLPGKGDLSQKEREALIAEHGESAVYTKIEKAKAKVVISAVGGIVEPRDWTGKVPGLENFKGPVMHSARWKYDVDFNDKDVVVLGAGSTASQVVPALIEKPQNARSVTQIMRSPPWVAPKRVPPGGHEGFAKWSPSVLGSVPWMATLLRYVVFHQMETEFDMMFKTGDPDKVAKNRAVAQTRYLGFMKRVVPAKYHEILTPRYTLMCKRRVFDAGWFRSLNDDRINLELGEIADMGESSLTVGLYDPKRTSDNTSYHHNKTLRTETEANGTAAKTNSRNAVVAKKEVPCDVLVLANGYEMGTWIHPIRVYGRGGASIHDTWESRGGPQMYLGTAIDGFPNFFMIFGPNTASGHSSVIVGAESSVEHALKFIRKIFVTKEVETFEVKEKPCRDYVREIHRLLKMTAFSESGLTGCGSSYIKDGWNSTVYPRSQTDFALRCRFPNMNHWNATYTTKGRIWNILRQTVFSGGISAVAFWFYLARYGGETWRTGFNTVFKTVLDRAKEASLLSAFYDAMSSSQQMSTATQKVRFSNGKVTAAGAAKDFVWENPVPVNKFWDSFLYCDARTFLSSFSEQELEELPIDPNSSQDHRAKVEFLLQLLREKLAKKEAATEPPQSLYEKDFKQWNDLWRGIYAFENQLDLPQAEDTIRMIVRKRQDQSNLSVCHMLADHLVKVGKYAEAEETERPVCAWMDEHPSLGKDSPQSINARRIIAKALWFQGETRRSEAEAMVAEIHALAEGMGDGKFGVYQETERELNQAMMSELQ